MSRVLITLVLAVAAISAVAAPRVDRRVADRPKMMWLDLSGMWTRFTNPDTVAWYMDRIVDCGFNTVIIDVKNTGSAVGYPSRIAPQLTDWKGVRIEPEYDYLDVVLRAAKQRGLTAYAAFNIFCESYPHFKLGILRGDTLSWQARNYLPGAGITAAPENEGPGTSFCNPALPEVQRYEQSVLAECARRYPMLDGIMVDRCRYDNITSDFSDYSRERFEEYIGEKVDRFPEDIYEWVETDGGEYRRKEGRWFRKWLEWRASVIYNFFSDTRRIIKEINPRLGFGAYTGAWYPSYYEVGVNWASRSYDPSKDFDWATPGYRDYALAELLDLYTNGNYYKAITIDEYRRSSGQVKNETDSEFQTGDHLCVEGACRYSRMLMGDQEFCGGLYVVDYDTDRQRFKDAVKMNLIESDGLMVFELYHIIRTGWFDALREAITEAEQELSGQSQP